MSMHGFGVVAMVVVGIATGAGGTYWLTTSGRLDAIRMDAAPTAASSDKSVLYWYDPMVPGQRFDKPGKSPFMDMQLVPKYADDAGNGTSVRIDPGVAQNLGVRLARVERGALSRPLIVVASIAFDERDVATVQSRTNGFVERIYDRAPGDVVAKGAPLVDLLVPEWAGAQTEFLALAGIGDADLTAAARQRLKLLGMSADLIARVERSGKIQPTITIAAPIAGVIQALEVRTGMTVAMGMTLVRLNGIAAVWLDAAVPEAQSGLIGIGSPVEARLPAYLGEAFTGTVRAVLPAADPASRTVTVRVELPNMDGRLRPGMVAQARLTGLSEDGLLVPSEAVIRTGRRDLVFVVESEGRFRPVEVQTGGESDGRTIIRGGLEEGQQVVASGQFLIDSEASLSGVLARLDLARSNENQAVPKAIPTVGTGKVEEVTGGEITLSHGPMPAIGWGAMTMSFKLKSPDLAAGFKPGDAVRFSLMPDGDTFVVEQIEKTGGAQ